MIRASLVVLVVLLAILAFVLDHTWLYAVSGVSLLVTLGWFAVYGWSAYHRRKRDAARQDSDREHRLQDFGIVSIRPQEKASSDVSSMSTPASPSSSPGTSVDQGRSTTDHSKQSSPTSDATSSPATSSPDASRTAPSQRRSDQASPVQGNGASASTTGSSTVARTPADVPEDVEDRASASDASSTTVAASKTGTGITTSPRMDEPVLVPLVESLRAAVEAYSVCLLVQEDVVLEYHIRAIASQSASIQRDGAFSTSDPLLTASMSRQPITVRRIEGGRSVVAGYLRYYDEPPEIDHIALAPVPIRDTATTTFLLVDATESSDLGAPNARAIIEQYAETVALVLQSGATASAEKPASDDAHRPVRSNMHGDSTPSRTGTPRVRESDPVPADSDQHPDLFSTSDAPRTGEDDGTPHATPASEDAPRQEASHQQGPEATAPHATSDEPSATEQDRADTAQVSDSSTSKADRDAPESDDAAADEDDDKPRPRREIIEEEMAAADAQGHELALALIHLNRAESIARSGMDAVETAEAALRSRLQSAAPDQRVVRFGELTYGVFFRAGLDRVEPWAIDLQDRMDAATGTLEGGASIGVALRGSRHDGADALRADATRALREAYETGTCTIIE